MFLDLGKITCISLKHGEMLTHWRQWPNDPLEAIPSLLSQSIHWKAILRSRQESRYSKSHWALIHKPNSPIYFTSIIIKLTFCFYIFRAKYFISSIRNWEGRKDDIFESLML